MRVHQLTNGLMMGDAVSNHTLEIDRRLREWGYETAVYAGYIAPEMQQLAQPDARLTPFLAETDDIFIFHYSIYNPHIRLFRSARGRRLLIYHNITPPHFFAGWDAGQEALCALGRQALRTLTGADLAVGDSDYNRGELTAVGFDENRTDTLPIFLTMEHYQSLPEDSALQARLRQGGMVNWLAVGRVAPNKKLEDVIRIFAIYNQTINPDSRLRIVGSRYLERYAAALDDLVAALGMREYIHFAGRVDDGQLKTYYQTADLLITASQHEGFCVPLLESMYFGVPILARNSSAIPETLGGAGVLFSGQAYEVVAETAHLLLTDRALREQIIRRQKARLQELGPERTERKLRQIMRRLQA